MISSEGSNLAVKIFYQDIERSVSVILHSYLFIFIFSLLKLEERSYNVTLE